MIKIFKAFIVSKKEDGTFQYSFGEKSIDDLPDGDLLIKVEYSSLNYKDALSASGVFGITKKYPHTPGIDVAGIIEKSENPSFTPGTKVIVTGFDLGVNTSGGFAEYIRVPSTWVIRCPENLTTKQSMMIGTAGLTAGLCIAKIEQQLSLDSLKVIVSGATGGVSSIAIKILYNLGAKVTGITGKNNEEKFLKEIGCSEIIHRQEFIKSTRLPLNKGLYDAAVDVAGGNILSCIIASMKYNGIITACGNVAGPKLETTVFPFILRGNQLVGIDSATSSIKLREQVWNNFSSIWELNDLHRICKTISLNDLPFEIKKILQGKQIGRILVKI